MKLIITSLIVVMLAGCQSVQQMHVIQPEPTAGSETPGGRIQWVKRDNIFYLQIDTKD